MNAPQIHIEGGAVVVSHVGGKTSEMSIAEFVERVGTKHDCGPGCGTLPIGVRHWIQRGDTVGLCIEIPPSARSVQWLADDSPVPYGERAVYERRYLSFPYVEILLVLHDGQLTGQQQLFYRREPLGDDDTLLLPNLLNVSPDAYGQKAWLCLVNLPTIAGQSWQQKIKTVVQHTFSAKFNRSSDTHEGSSYWQLMRDVDPRVSSVAAWHDATTKNPCFALDVPWKRAERGLTDELGSMMEQVQAAATLTTAEELAGMLAVSNGSRRRRRRLGQLGLF
ncbi:MAG: hypothetical protein E4H03_13320 [Myxococcales bacterium]|nr:MAG: hypothetical protein E4H03_13320 [Myxococcales bacterium]